MSDKMGKLLVSLGSIFLLALAPASTSQPRFSEEMDVPSEVVIGSDITAKMIDIEYHGETKKATSCTIYTPTGAKINSNKVVFSEAGNYIFEFAAMFGEERVSQRLEVMSLRTPISMFSTSNASVSTGSFKYSDSLDESVGSEYNGVVINSRDGGVVTFNKILDFSNSSINEPFIDFIVEPSILGSYDVGEMLFTLTDADDLNNKVDIRFVDGYAGSGGAKRLTYATARATDQYYAGYENWNGQWHVNNDQTGAPTFLTFRGLDEEIIESFHQTGYLNSQLFFEYSSKKQILVKSEYKVKNSTVLINDLDDPEFYPTNPWSGFKNNRAILSITTKDVSGVGAKYIVKSIFGYDLSQELFRDSQAPTLAIDFEGYDRNNLPLAKINNTYPVFNADVFDDFDDDLLFHKKVQYFDRTNGTYIDIEINDDRFVTNCYGEYKVSYYCSDRSGNFVEDSYIVNCSPIVADMEIIVDVDEEATHRAFEEVYLGSLNDVTVKNARGKVDLRRYLITPNGDRTELRRDYFIPEDIGNYKVEYVAQDIYEKPVSKIVSYDIQNILHPCIVDPITLPSIVIKDQYFDVPRVLCKYPDGNSIADGDVDIYVNNQLFTDDKLFVNSLDVIHIDYVPHSSFEDKVSFAIAVVKGVDENGRTIKENYFHSEDKNSYRVENIKNKSMQFSINGDAEINFIKSVSSDNLSLSFELDESTISNYDSFNIKVVDKYDDEKSLTLKVTANGNALKLGTPNNNALFDLDCSEEKQFVLYYKPFTKVLSDRNYKDICVVKYYDNGEPFLGFSSEVNVSFGFEGNTSESNVSLVYINNQSFKTSIVRDNAGPQIVVDNNLNWANELGEEITVSKAMAFDVLSYVKSLAISITDSEGNKILDKADASIDRKIVLNKYGNYRIEYTSEDGNGRYSNRSFTICCIENEPPSLSINFTPKDHYSVGYVFTFPKYKFNDNSKNCYLDVCLYLPSGQGIAIEHASMVNGEVTVENYLDLDHYSDDLVKNNKSVRLYMAGKYTLRYTVVDAYGNVNYKEFILNVR